MPDKPVLYPYHMALATRISAILLVIVSAWAPASAGPRVSVRGRATIELNPVRRVPSGIEVSGRMIERASGDPIAFAQVVISIDGVAKDWMTGGDGTFEIQALVDPTTTHDVAVEFAGDSQYSGAVFEIKDLDVKKQPLSLELEVGELLDQEPGSLVVRASSGGEPVAIAVAIEIIRPPGAAEPFRAAVTNDSGEATVELDRDDLGAPGRLRFRASFPGDASFDAAEASADTTLRSDTQLTMRLSRTDLDYGDDISARGELFDDRGLPVPAQVVTLEIDGQEVASATTDERGEYRLAMRTSSLQPETTVSAQAVFKTQVSHLGSSRSEPLAARIGVRKPIPVRYTLAAFGVATVALIAFVGLRTRPWQRWLDALRPRSEADRQSEPAARDQKPHTGLAPARPSLRMTLRRASDRGFAGEVHCATTQRVLPGARVAIVRGDARFECTCDDAGTFELTADADGDWQAEVASSGYVSERFTVTFPHRGELRGARVDLLPVREKIFELYRQVAEPLLPESGKWGLWTPRQIVDHVRAGGQLPALAALTDFVEEAYFSQRTPLEETLPRAAEMVQAARAENSHSR